MTAVGNGTASGPPAHWEEGGKEEGSFTRRQVAAEVAGGGHPRGAFGPQRIVDDLLPPSTHDIGAAPPSRIDSVEP